MFAQDLGGTWQGTLTAPNGQTRIVLQITRAADGRFDGQLFAIDQGAQPRTMSAISLEGRVVKWKVDALSATYEGTLTSDGNAMNGAQFASFGTPNVPDSGKPNIYEAFREQLGLRLEATRAPANILVIDKVEKPSDD